MNAQLEIKEDTAIVEFNPFQAQLAELEKDYGTRVYDLDDPVEDKAARSDRLKVAKVISAFEAVRKEAKADAQKRVRLVDGIGKEIRDRMEAVRDSIKAQIDAKEQREVERCERLQEMVDLIRSFAECINPVTGQQETLDVEEISKRIESVKDIDVDDSYEDRKADATLAQVETIKLLESMLAERLKYEAEQAELERLRKEAEERAQKDREDAIRKEAEEKAKQEAAAAAQKAAQEAQEKAEREKREAAEKAQAEIDAANRAKREAEETAERAAAAERERIEKEQREAAAKAECERKAEEAKKAKQAHRAKIHKQAKESLLMNVDISEELATEIIEVIKDAKITNVQIIY